jgi:hypothetical protein
MRQQHQKSRSRGRGRKPQNPMSRNYESNGPDVKIRGNAAHIAEKYSTLARDALSNGDRVIAENYLQHAEHYNRIVAAAQAQQAQQRNERQEQDSDNQSDNQNDDNQAKGRDDQASENQADTKEAGNKPNGKGNGKANGSRSRHSDKGSDEADDNGQQDASSSSEEQSDEQAPRKTTRGRRPRKVSETKNGKSSDTDDDKGKELPVEAISDDAAKLPESITGGMISEDS